MTKLKKTALAAAFAVAAVIPGMGMAQGMGDTGWYAGAQIGNAEVFDEDDTAWKVFGGYQVNRNIGAELGYTNLGEVDVPGGSAEATAIELLGVGKFPLANQFSIYGLVGFAMVEVDVSGPFSNLSDDSTELTYGIGAQYDFSRNMGVRLQWQRYDTEEEVDVMSVGVVFKF